MEAGQPWGAEAGARALRQEEPLRSGNLEPGGDCRAAWQEVLRRAFALAEVPYQSPHRARAGFLTEMLGKGVGLVEARDLAGHGSATTTDRYLTSTTDRLRRAVNVLG